MKTLNCNYEMFNPNIVSGEGCYVIDEKGRRYMDCESGVWCLPLGHNNKRVNGAILRQISALSHVGYRYSAKIVEEAAESVLDLLSFGGGKCTFLSSGSEAVEFGVKIAGEVMKGPYFLCLDKHFLSSYGISAVRNERNWISLDVSKYGGDAEEYLKDIPFDKIGAFVFEPGNASGTVQLPPVDLIKSIERRLKESGGLIVVDEVTTGTGRTGKWFGFQHYGISPDIVSFGKGIGNGYPVSVAAVSKYIADLIENSNFKYAQSHQNDPLGCAVVREVIDVIESGSLIRRSEDMGAVLGKELKSLMKRHRCIKDVRGIGLMYVMEFFPDERTPLAKIHRELFDAGYITGFNASANLLRFYPPLVVLKTDIEGMANALDTILNKYELKEVQKQNEDFTVINTFLM